MASSMSSSLSDEKPPPVAAQNVKEMHDKQSVSPHRSPGNWFFSLRRQPRIKRKKSTLATAAGNSSTNEAPLQRSCIDLSTPNSIFYLNNNNNIEENSKTHSNSEAISSSSYLQLVAESTDNIFEKQKLESSSTRRRVGTMTQLCSPCCCASKSSAGGGGAMLTYDAPIKKHSSKYETLDDNCQTNISATSDSKMVTLVKKKSEFLRTTSVTTTSTLIITRPVEVLLNDKGEIVQRCRHMTTNVKNSSSSSGGVDVIGDLRLNNRLSNSLDCVLDNERILNDDALITANVTPTSFLKVFELRPSVLASCDDLQYIDDNNIIESNNNAKNLYALNNNNNTNVENQNKNSCDKSESPTNNKLSQFPTTPNQYSNQHHHHGSFPQNNNNNNNKHKNINKMNENEQHENKQQFIHHDDDDAVIINKHNNNKV